MAPIDPLQCRMARAALNLSLRDLAKLAHMPVSVLSRFENGKPLSPERDARLRFTFDEAGVSLVAGDDLNGPGVRLRKWFNNGFVFDRDGKQVASILGQSIVDAVSGERIGTVEGDAVFGLDGTSIGLLGTVDTFAGTGSLPDTTLSLLLGPGDSGGPSGAAGADP